MSKKNNKKEDKETKKRKVTSDNTKKAVKSLKRRKKKTASSLKKVVADKFWKSEKDSTGKITKGRKRKKKLSRKEEKNRYQSIVKTISEYYKKAGSPLKRGDLYKKYREVRDEFSNVPAIDLENDFEKIVIQRKATRTFPAPLILGIDWFNFEDIMTSSFSQQFFRSNDTIILDLSCLGMNDMSFPYSNVIGSYNNLYNDITFRTAVKSKKSPPPQFTYSSLKSKPNNGLYVFDLVDCPPVAGVIQPTTSQTTPNTIGDILNQNILKEGPIGDILNMNTLIEQRKNIIQERISTLQKEKVITKELYLKDKITKMEYNNEIVELEDSISDLISELSKI